MGEAFNWLEGEPGSGHRMPDILAGIIITDSNRIRSTEEMPRELSLLTFELYLNAREEKEKCFPLQKYLKVLL